MKHLSVDSPLLCLLHIFYSLALVLVKYLKHASFHYSQASYLPLQVSLNQRQYNLNTVPNAVKNIYWLQILSMTQTTDFNCFQKVSEVHKLKEA